jgi:tRNA A-37 threonylcarbamoyl transferase component Bud32
VADGEIVDWVALLDGAANADERQFIRHLQAIAAVPPFVPTSNTLHDSIRRVQAGDAADLDLPAVHWGHLRIIEKVGRGSFGDVYRAWDTRLDREVALKLLRRKEEDKAGAVIEEGKLLAQVRHPNVVCVYGAERIGGRTGIWTEFLRGQTLRDLVMERGSLPDAEVRRTGAALCRALSAVHRAGLVHGDIKAQNVIACHDGRVVLTDFGASRSHLTTEGHTETFGTPLYVAPEVLAGAPPAVRSDIYSLGVLLEYLSTGRLALELTAKTLDGIKAAHEARSAAARHSVGLPSSLTAIINRATHPNPEHRFRAASDLRRALERRTFRPFTKLIGDLAFILLVLLFLSFGWRQLNEWARQTQRMQLSWQTYMMMGNVGGALEARDQGAARDILRRQLLTAENRRACLYQQEGKLMAEVLRFDAQACPFFDPLEANVPTGYLRWRQTRQSKDGRVGALVIESLASTPGREVFWIFAVIGTFGAVGARIAFEHWRMRRRAGNFEETEGPAFETVSRPATGRKRSLTPGRTRDVVAVVIALVLAGGAWTLLTNQLRQTRQSEIQRAATITLASVSTAVAFELREEAVQALRVLMTNPIVRRACLYDQRGLLFATTDGARTFACAETLEGAPVMKDVRALRVRVQNDRRNPTALIVDADPGLHPLWFVPLVLVTILAVHGANRLQR